MVVPGHSAEKGALSLAGQVSLGWGEVSGRGGQADWLQAARPSLLNSSVPCRQSGAEELV
jgi:hypothetical protein